jgi:Ca2+-binding RTX toxin-like protein
VAYIGRDDDDGTTAKEQLRFGLGRATGLIHWTGGVKMLTRRRSHRLLLLGAPFAAALLIPATALAATFTGTPGPDHIVGTASADVISGLAGNDILEGRGGADVISGGQGNDRISGGPGNDVIYGGSGNDILYGGDQADVIVGGAGHDFVYGGQRHHPRGWRQDVGRGPLRPGLGYRLCRPLRHRRQLLRASGAHARAVIRRR